MSDQDLPGYMDSVFPQITLPNRNGSMWVFIAIEQKDTIYQGMFFKYVDGNMQRWVQELGNLCCRPQMLSYTVHSFGIDGHNVLLRQGILKRFLDAKNIIKALGQTQR